MVTNNRIECVIRIYSILRNSSFHDKWLRLIVSSLSTNIGCSRVFMAEFDMHNGIGPSSFTAFNKSDLLIVKNTYEFLVNCSFTIVIKFIAKLATFGVFRLAILFMCIKWRCL